MTGFQHDTVMLVKRGYDGSSVEDRWTFPNALMFTLSLITTIGYIIHLNTHTLSVPPQFLATFSNYATRQVRGHGAGVGVRENCHDDLRDLGDSSVHSVFPKHWEGIVIFADHSYSQFMSQKLYL